MTIIQIVVFRLRRTYNNVELACNKHHVEALSKLEETEGFYKGVWSVTKEDASILVWLIEWRNLPQAATPCMRDSIIVSDRYCASNVAPSEMLSLDYPVLQLFQYRLVNGSSLADDADAMKLATARWKAEARPFSVVESFSHLASHNANEKVYVMIVPWQSKEEQKSALMQGYFKKAMEEAEPMRGGFG